jgi:hypothetical protein
MLEIRDEEIIEAVSALPCPKLPDLLAAKWQ